MTGATPDGRKSGEILSLNCAPSHGTVSNGLSSVLKSVTSIRLGEVDNACPLDVQLSGDVPPGVVESIIEYLQRHGALYAQFSVLDTDTLMRAREQPELYQDLVVRVTGFSARFVSLPRDTQNEIIRRSHWN
jgi:formate C-acetyltransferase